MANDTRAKKKGWGFITAAPAEFLVHVRGGRVRTKTSGQGASCFKWPWDSVAIVPTSLQRVSFTADQITLEKVGVEVTGLAVYRIADPLIAYRVLDFADVESAKERLDLTLTSMLVGATRRLVANLGVEDCLQKRKAAIAGELLREIAPVVGGTGRADDETDRGWGVVIDTIEIQEVRILSDGVFAKMQAPYRAALDRAAREARADADQRSALAEAVAQREIERARLANEVALIESRRALAEADLATHAQELEAIAARIERENREHAAALERRRAEAEAIEKYGRAEAEVALAKARAERERAEATARVTMAQNLPQLAAAVGQKFGEVRVTQIGSDGTPFGSVAQAVASVIELARKA